MQYNIRLVCCRIVINFSQNRFNHFALEFKVNAEGIEELVADKGYHS
jgi:hypothetical protein